MSATELAQDAPAKPDGERRRTRLRQYQVQLLERMQAAKTNTGARTHQLGVQIGAVMFGSLMLQTIVSAVYTVLVYPVIAITEALLYYDTRIKSEGLDIELMAGALEPAAPREPAAS